MGIQDHQLTGNNCEHIRSKNHSGSFTAQPSMIVIHYTASAGLKGAVDTLCDPASKASAHVVIDRASKIVQLLPFNTIAWHCGKSAWKGQHQLNKVSIGIELVNYGKLIRSRHDQYTTWFKKPVNPEEVFIDKKGVPWHEYTEFQIMTVISICRALCEHYPIKTILGHSEIAPNRKMDPGPAFDMKMLREQVLYGDRRDETTNGARPWDSRRVTSHKLNCRDNPSMEHGNISAVLRSGQHVDVKSVHQGWAYVTFEQSGWVREEYLKKTV